MKNNIVLTESHFQAFFDGAPIGKCMTAPTGQLLRVNMAFAEILGYSQDEMHQVSFRDITHPDDLAESVKCVRCLLDGEQDTYRMEKRYLAKDGRYVWTLVTTRLLRDDSGEPQIFLTHIMDISDRKHLETELQKIEWLLSPAEVIGETGVIHSPSYGDLTALNTDGEILRSVGKETLENIAGDYVDLLGTSGAIYERNGDYAVGIFASQWCRFMDEASRKQCDTKDNTAALESGKWLCHESCWTQASKVSIERGEAVDIACCGGLRLYAYPISADGEIIGSINVGYGEPPDNPEQLNELAQQFQVDPNTLKRYADAYEKRPTFIVEIAKQRLRTTAQLIGQIVERHRAEHALENALTELSRSNRELEQFAYVASHDLQEPLRMVASYTQLLEERYKGKLDEKADKFINYAVDGARRMQGLINDLLRYSRVATRGQEFVPVDCNVVLDHIQRDLGELISQTGGTIDFAALPAIEADPTQFRQLLQNLVENGIKYHGELPPKVTVSAERMPDCWEFCVSDNGIGIDPKFQERIFVIFQRLHQRGEYPGNGIGLALVKRIVERHGGSVRLESEPDRGSKFYFTIPDNKPRLDSAKAGNSTPVETVLASERGE